MKILLEKIRQSIIFDNLTKHNAFYDSEKIIYSW